MRKPKQISTKIHISRDYFIISAAHFAVLSDGSSEPLHGHNYEVSVEIAGKVSCDEYIVDFSVLKQGIRHLVKQINHRTIVPTLCSDLKITQDSGNVRILTKDKKFYELPESDVAFLTIKNATVEALANYLADKIANQLPASVIERLESMLVKVEESSGQGASCYCKY